MSNNKFEVSNVSLINWLSTISNAGIQIRIPEYQRDYSWLEENALELWEDLILNETDASLFLGSVVTNSEYHKDKYLDIVDGQQRILTLTILVAALRDIQFELNRDNHTIFNLIQDSFVSMKDEIGLPSKDKFKIKCGKEIENFFKKFIQEHNEKKIQPVSKAEKKIKKNYLIFKSEIKKYLDNDERKVIEILKKIRLIDLIIIGLESEEKSFEVFETLNSRGVNLTVTDLTKNLIIEKLEHKKGIEKWSELKKHLKADSDKFEIDQFIRYFWISKYEDVSKKQLFKKIKKQLKEKETYGIFIDELIINADIFRNISISIDVTDQFWNNINDKQKIVNSLLGLIYMKSTQQNVLLLSIFRNIDKVENPFKLIEFIEKFSFRYFAIMKQPANQVETVYGKYAQKIEKCKDKNESLVIYKDICDELISKMPSINNEIFIENLYENIKYKKKDNIIKFIFCKYFDKESSKTLENDIAKSTLEHIFPQNPELKIEFEDEEMIHSIGNMLMLGEKLNSGLGKKLPSEKLDAYSNESRYQITRDFAKDNNKEVLKTTWDLEPEKYIKERLKNISEKLSELTDIKSPF